MIKIGNLLDNYNLDYSKVENDKLLAIPRNCSGCCNILKPFSKIMSLEHNNLNFIICLSCAQKIIVAIDKIPEKHDGEYCKYCNNFSPMLKAQSS